MNKEEWKEKVQNEGINNLVEDHLGNFTWGSCQYETAAGMFSVIQTMKEDIPLGEIFEVLDVNLTMGRICSIDDAKFKLIKQLIENVDRSGDDEDLKKVNYQLKHLKLTMNRISFDEIKASAKTVRETIGKDTFVTYTMDSIMGICDAKTGDNLFDVLKDSAWDLWTTAETICDVFFDGIEFDNTPQSPGFGPPMNVQVQNQNYQTALYCALLYEYKIVQNIDSFKEFDT